ncbi:hypothetical protein GCM10009000_065900 [Halobacterium noricense]|uniref:Transposase n=1 Tax=Haladaptatus pallidirubidus TaxID=1008152 RepID=A0AAV3UH82_9EURY
MSYLTLLAHDLRRSLLEGGAYCFNNALSRHNRVRRERSLHRRFFGVNRSYVFKTVRKDVPGRFRMAIYLDT